MHASQIGMGEMRDRKLVTWSDIAVAFISQFFARGTGLVKWRAPPDRVGGSANIFHVPVNSGLKMAR